MSENLLFLSFTTLDYDGRTKELLKLIDPYGSIHVVSCMVNEKKDLNKNYDIIKIKNKSKYLTVKNLINFFLLSVKTAFKLQREKKIDTLFIDNLYSAITGYLIYMLFKPKKLIIDCREYYIREQQTSRKLKVFCLFEELLIKNADIVIVANEERSQLAKQHYSLDKKPIVFENIRVIDSEATAAELKAYEEKYSKFIHGKKNIISTGGYSLHRLTLELLAEFKEIKDNANLVIVGGGTEKDKHEIDNYIEKYDLKNVYLLEKVLPQELKYLMQQSHIGVVIYPMHDDNNKYCASGKIYEYIDCGIPIITSENPPLKTFIETHEVGISNNHFSKAYDTITQNYQYYKDNVKLYNQTVDYSEYLNITYSKIMKELQ
ncbi:glycosyltransferase [Exiguobacterium sp. s152]|uniref:glycosyltransferase n=1 Tax=Exiguobacterium sp. s152 TaxID=2751226 RepID=UPI001BE8AE0F|nr:glycosyltransferase [Exiguobacterium sp. s152]